MIERLLLAKASTSTRDWVVGNTPLHILATLPEQDGAPESKRKCSGDCTCCGVDNWRILDTNGHLKDMKEMSTDRFNDTYRDEGIPRSVSPGGLIDLILPFAGESKSLANSEGFMPWQLASNRQIAA